MIDVNSAKAKIRQIAPVSDKVYDLFCAVLDRKRGSLTQKESFLDPLSREWVEWVKHRLAQPHLGYLDPHKCNQSWGGDMTDALALLAHTYNIAYDKQQPIIGSDLLRALLDGTKSAESSIAPKLSYDWFKAIYAKHGYTFETDKMRFNVLGVRGYLVAKGAVPNVGDVFNDTIFLIYRDSAGVEQVKSWVATVDPGAYYYSYNPMNPAGCAHLVEGQYLYQRGLHGSRQYPAFVEAGNVTVARSNTANYDDHTPRETGSWFGIHIHSSYGTQTVWNNSAGCQVAASASPYDEPWLGFHALLNQHDGQTFHYTLVSSKDLA